MSGLFISFEGVDGCGKSTQMQLAAEYLESLGVTPILTREPGGCGIAESVRSILLDPANKNMDPWSEMLLYAAARAQHVNEIIQPAVRGGRVVISDRFLDSSLAYQGYGRGLGADAVLQANAAAADMMPDMTFFLDVPPDVGLARIHRNRDRIERSGHDFYARVYAGFVAEAQHHPDRIVRIDASSSVNDTQNSIRSELDRLLSVKGL